MSSIKKYFGSIFLCLLAFSCAVEAKPDVAAKPVKIRLGMLNLMSGGVVHLAKEKDFFREQGIELDILPFDAAQKVALAVASGDVDVGLTGLTAAVYNLAGKDKLKIIAGSSRDVSGWKGAAYVVSNKQWDAGIRKPSQLQNVSLGVTDKGSTFHYIAGLLAEKYHFSLKQMIKLVPLGSVAAMKTALATSQVDSVIIPGLVARKLEDEKQGHIIGYVGNETPWQVTAVFASSKLLKNDKKEVQRFLTGFEKGCALYHRLFNTFSPARCSTKELLAEFPEREHAATIISRYVKPRIEPVVISSIPVYIDAQCRLDLDSVKHQIQWYQARNMVDKGITVDQTVDRSLIEPLPHQPETALVQAP